MKVPLDHGRGQLDLLAVPWAAVPGNHDIGDNPLPGTPEVMAVTDGRRQRWLDVVGADYWSVAVADWILLAVNAQLAGSGPAAEARQWSWLEGQLRTARPCQRIALLTHKPLTAPVLSLTFGSGPAPEPRFHEPDGVRHLIQNEDIPDPYQSR